MGCGEKNARTPRECHPDAMHTLAPNSMAHTHLCVELGVRRCVMATNLAIDPSLLDHALEVGGLRTKKDTVTVALEEFIARRKRAKIVELFGTVDWDPNYDHKAERRARDTNRGLTN